MSDIVNIVDEEIRLNSGMGENAFGKTNYDSIISQKGILVTCDSKQGEPYHFCFEAWGFSEIKSFKIENQEEPYVFYCGKNPLPAQAQTLNQLYAEAGKEDADIASKEKMYKASYIVCAILTQAAKEKIEFPVNGAGGILIANIEDNKKLQLLFLPPNLFKYSSGGLPAIQQAELQGCWINPTLYQLPALCFERAVIAYKMLSGKFPYPNANNVERNADILDRRFLPIELSVNGINPQLAKEINRGLKLTSNAVTIPGKKTKGKKSEDLLPNPDFPLELLQNANQTLQASKLSDEELEQKAQSYIKTQSSKVNAKRRLRRNTTAIITTLIVVTIIGILVGTSVKSNLESYTSRGLTSTQTIQAFFKGVNDKDTVFLEEITKGKNPGRYVNTISTIYVLNKSRQTYNNDKGFMTPEGYLFFATDAINNKFAGVYGVSNVKIDGKLYELNPELHTKIERVPPVTVEKNINLVEGYKSVHAVEYYLVHTETEDNDIEVEYIEDTITLTYYKQRWVITEILSKSTPLNINSNKFKNDYYLSFKENNGDVMKAALQLQNKYPFIPSQNCLQREKDRLEEIAKNPFAGL